MAFGGMGSNLRQLRMHYSICCNILGGGLLIYCACGRITISVARFGIISPLWQNFKSLRHFLRVYLVFGTILNLLWQIFYAIGQIFTVVNGKIFNV